MSESESVRAMIRRVCSGHLSLLRPHTLAGTTYQPTYPEASYRSAAARSGARRRAGILTYKPLKTCACRKQRVAGVCKEHCVASCFFADLTLTMGEWGVPVYGHNDLLRETDQGGTWGSGGKD